MWQHLRLHEKIHTGQKPDIYVFIRSLEHEFILERFLTNFTSVKTKNKQTNKPYPHSSTSLQQYQSIYPGENTQQFNVCGKDLTQKSQDRNIMEPYFPDSVVWQILYLFHFMYSLMTLVQVLSRWSKPIFEEMLLRSFCVKETRILTQQR